MREVGNGNSRSKCNLLRDLLADEGASRRERTDNHPSPLEFENDLQLCEQTARQLKRWLDVQQGAEENEFRLAWSRVLHLIARMKPVRPREHTRKNTLHLDLCEIARKLRDAIEYMENNSQRSNRALRTHYDRHSDTPRVVVGQGNRELQGQHRHQEEDFERLHPNAVSNPLNLDRLLANFASGGSVRAHSSARTSDSLLRVQFRPGDSIIPDKHVEIPSSFNIPDEEGQRYHSNEYENNRHAELEKIYIARDMKEVIQCK